MYQYKKLTISLAILCLVFLLLLLVVHLIETGTQDLMIAKGDISLEQSEEGGYDLWIKKKPFVRSILLVSTSLDNTDSVKPLGSLFKSFGLNDFFRIDGTMLVPTENTKWFFGSSAIHEHPHLGPAFLVHIPYEINIDDSSVIRFPDGGTLSIIAFSKNRPANRTLYRVNRFDAIASQTGEGEIVVADKKEVQEPVIKTDSEKSVQSLQQHSQEPMTNMMEGSSSSSQASKEQIVVAAKREEPESIIKAAAEETAQPLQQRSQESAINSGMGKSSTSSQASKEQIVVAAKREEPESIIKAAAEETVQPLQQRSQEPAKTGAEDLSESSLYSPEPELVDSEENGYVLDATDPNNIKVYINRIFRFDPEHGIKDGSYGYVFRDQGEPIALIEFSVTNTRIVAILKELYQPQNPIEPFDKILLDLK